MNTRKSGASILLLFAAIAAAFVGLAIVGAIRNYSPVPYQDMWNGYLAFYIHVLNGDGHAWWAQFHEHRIVLARILFWIDLAWFNGTQHFLLIVNYLLIGTACAVFWAIWQERSERRYTYIALFLIAWLFSWSQKENLVWGFQSAFILAQLLPLAAFYTLHRATPGSPLLFAGAMVLGVLSAGSMVNGVLVLPLMTLYTVIVRMSRPRIASLALISVATLWLYFHNYRIPHHGTPPEQVLLEKPLQVIHYALLYIGGPFYYVFGKGLSGKIAAIIAGVLFIVSSLVFAWRIIPRAREATLPLAMLTFIAYIGASAFATASGRLWLPIDLALSSRYMTPTLMGWAAMLVLFAPTVASIDQRLRGHLWAFFLALAAVILPMQLHALQSQQGSLYARRIGALALALDIPDMRKIIAVNWFPETAFQLARGPRERHLSIFGLPPYKEAAVAINHRFSATNTPLRQCRGRIEGVRDIKGDNNHIAIQGWIYDPQRHSVPESLRLVNQEDIVVGVALAGKPRRDIARTEGTAARYAGFEGYALHASAGKAVKVIDPDSGCSIKADIPVPLFTVSRAPANASSVTVGIDQVANRNGWAGGHSRKSGLPGLTVLGTNSGARNRTGSLVLRLRRGDKLLYRSGLTGGRQTVTLIGDRQETMVLPTVMRWVQLDFSDESLPRTFLVKFSDNGDRAGESSAIAVKNNR